MTTNDILTLLSAGYTKDEITAMGGPAPLKQEPQPEPEPEPQQEPQQEPQPEPQPEPEPKPEPDIAGAVNERLNKIEHSLSDLISAIQKSNIEHDSFDGNPENLEQKAISAMQGIIRPDFKERK